MKIILSRKGFDDQYGSKPSIILPDGKMLSFPIPAPEDEFGYRSDEIQYGNTTMSEYFDQLDLSRYFENKKFHLDPWIQHNNTIGAFGQSSSALSHLINNNISTGDVFLFFGTFCKTYFDKNKNLNYESMHSFHAVWGYLTVESIIDLSEEQSIPEQLKSHVHYINRKHQKYKNGNQLYISSDFGTFNFKENLILTKLGYKKSYWRLPSSFINKDITYHNKVTKRVIGDAVEFTSRSKGQEFVIDNNDHALDDWLFNIIKS